MYLLLYFWDVLYFIGGREKCIDLKVSLKDCNGAVVTSRKVKLKVTLCYYGGAVVNAQDLLALSPDSKLSIDGDFSGGETVIKYRINEVSKTHQSQPFCLLICPDTSVSPLNADIAPATSVPVEIRSKRNNSSKRPRENKAWEEMGADTIPANLYKLTKGNTSSSNLIGQANNHGGGGGSNKKHKQSKQAAVDMLQQGLGLPQEQDDYVLAVDNVVKWTNSVIESLQDIQWKPIGYQNTGNPHAEPQVLYNIPNPVDTIRQLLTRYTADVHNNLIFLMNCNANVGNTSTSTGTSKSGAGNGVGIIDDELTELMQGSLNPGTHGISSAMQLSLNLPDEYDLASSSNANATAAGRNSNSYGTAHQAPGRTHSLMFNPLTYSHSLMNSASSALLPGPDSANGNGMNASMFQNELNSSVPLGGHDSTKTAHVLAKAYYFSGSSEEDDLASSSNVGRSSSSSTNRLWTDDDLSKNPASQTPVFLGCPSYDSIGKLVRMCCEWIAICNIVIVDIYLYGLVFLVWVLSR